MNELYIYSEFDGNNGRDVIISREQILKEYWPYWYSMMLKAKKLKEINTDNCVTDFCIIHWAYPYKGESNGN